MDKKIIVDKLKSIIDVEHIYIDEAMKNHTTFKVGGPADILVIPSSEKEIVHTVKICRDENLPLLIVGNGSNLLVRDGGIRGVVLKLNDNYSGISVEDDVLVAKSGAILSRVSDRALENSLTGFEFASGIPGTIGGAITMNAGAYGGEIKNIVESVKCIDPSGNIRSYTCHQMNFGYRKSLVQEENLIVLEARLKLSQGEYHEIKDRLDDLRDKRVTKQPLDIPSGGSTFKRPEGYYAGKLIEDAGLRGFRYRDVQVSEKHCGFVVNVGDSTACDVITLIETVQKIVHDEFGVKLEPEVRIIGEV